MNAKDKIAFLEIEKRTAIRTAEPVPNWPIFRVEGTATNEFTRSGKVRPVSEYNTMKVVAFEVQDPNGFVFRFAHKYEAILFAKASASRANLLGRGWSAGHFSNLDWKKGVKVQQ
jgi:hypothetical protein